MLKVQVDSARVDIDAKFTREGSLLDYTIEAGCAGIEVHVEVDSPDDPERVAGLLRNAEAGCYVMKTFRNPTPVTTTYELNGQPIEAKAPATT
jgi:uncharacterized OsmC-like protein